MLSYAKNSSYAIKGTSEIVLTLADWRELCLPDVLYVQGITKNLLSVSSFTTREYLVHFEDDKCVVRNKEHENWLVTTGTLKNDMFVLDTYDKDENACMTNVDNVHVANEFTQPMHDAKLWHARFGHVNYASLLLLQHHGMVEQMPKAERPFKHVCEGCVLGKMHRYAFPKDG